MPDEATKQAEKLKTIFITDPRFESVSLIASGGYGSATRVRYSDPKLPSITEFLVKRAFKGTEARTALMTEREYLTRLRNNRHIPQLYSIPNNPLRNARVDKRDWIIMEWVGCGTLESFITLAKKKLRGRQRRGQARDKKLPNRLLWRLFLCLIRSCIAMAWPEARENLSDEPPSRIVHGDMHPRNVLLGEPPMDEEHTFTPILKLIDFGLASEQGPQPTAQETNLLDIGDLMVALIHLNEPPYAYETPTVDFNDMPRFKTDARSLVPFPRDIDPALVYVVSVCMAIESDKRPSLGSLLESVSRAVRERTADSPEEQDDAIGKLWREIVFDAPEEENDQEDEPKDYESQEDDDIFNY